MARTWHTLTLAAFVLLTAAVLTPERASADHRCEVQGVEIACDDPGVTPAHRDFCNVLHYHGTLNGVTDDGSGCGHGEVTVIQHGPPAFTNLDGALAHLGFSGPQINELSKIGTPIDPQRYRYATDISGPATLDADWTRVTSHGVFEVEFGPDSLVGMGGFECNTLGDGYRTFCANEPPQPGVTYTGFYTTFGDEFPVVDTGGLSVNLSWPTTIAGKDTWQYQGDFVGDTWQGSSYIPYLTYGPDPWGLHVSKYENGTLIDEPDSQAFGLIGGNTSLLFAPTSELMQGELTWDGFASGFALHVHDGSFGSCPDCTSVVTPYPAFPRDGLAPFVENEVFIANGPGEAATDATPAQDGTATGDTTGTTDSTTDTGSTDGAVTDGSTTNGAAGDDGGGGITRIILIAVVVAGVGLVIVGITIIRGRTRTRPPFTKPTLPGTFDPGGTRTRNGGDQFTSTPPPAPIEETPSCDCTVSVTIEGPTEFGVCCMRPKYSLNQCEDMSEGFDEMRQDPSKVHLDADVEGKDGWDLFDAFYQASISATCEGGGEAQTDDATYDWSVTSDDNGVTVTCKVSVPVRCPDGVEHAPAEAEASLRATYHSAPCTITVIVERVAWNEISHVDVQIVCGEYNEIFGYFPNGPRTFAGTIAGAPGQVIRTSTARARRNRRGWTSEIVDEVGSDYGTSHSGKSLNVYFIEPEDCSVCEKLRDEWEQLAANPGTYYLLSTNCASKAYDTLTAAGAVPIDFEGGPSTPSGMEDHLNDFRGSAAVSGVTISEATEIR